MSARQFMTKADIQAVSRSSGPFATKAAANTLTAELMGGRIMAAVNEVGRLIVITFVVGILASSAASTPAHAQAGSTGGTIGKTDKSLSGGKSVSDDDASDVDGTKAHHTRSVRRSSHETGLRRSHEGGDSICAHVRSAVRAATAAGLDNGVGLIAAARAQCGG
jgi:hypothetical protein